MPGVRQCWRQRDSRVCEPGDYVELRAEIDCVVAFSACPDDVYRTNGGDGTPADAHFAIFDPAA